MKAALRKTLTAVLGERGFADLRSTVQPAVVDMRRALARRPTYRLGDGLHDTNLREFAEPGTDIWFGYYDVTPFDTAETRLLAMRRRHGDDTVEVGYLPLEEIDGAFVPLGRSETWCWQQGCRLQWLPGDARVIHNRLVDGRYGAAVLDATDGTTVRTYDTPVYALAPDASWAVSLNFTRLQRLRPGYGYTNLPDPTRDDPCPTDDGLRRLDLATGKAKFLLSTAEIAALAPQPSMQDATHYLNHALVNPTGTRFMFFHLWLSDGRRRTRLMTCDRDGGDLRVVIDDGTVSHCCWRDETALLAYVVGGSHGGGYRLYRDGAGDGESGGPAMPAMDGHPTFRPDGGKILTDTYPDGWQERSLYMCGAQGETARKLGNFLSPPRLAGEERCDLHPRWSPSGRRIAFDSAHRGRRGLYILDVAAVLR